MQSLNLRFKPIIYILSSANRKQPLVLAGIGGLCGIPGVNGVNGVSGVACIASVA